MYAFTAIILHPAVLYWIVSGVSSCSLHPGPHLVWFYPGSYRSCSQRPSLCYHDQCSFNPAFFSYRQDFLKSATSSVMLWAVPRRAFSSHNGSNWCLPSGSCCLRYSPAIYSEALTNLIQFILDSGSDTMEQMIKFWCCSRFQDDLDSWSCKQRCIQPCVSILL